MDTIVARRLPDFVLLVYVLAVTVGGFTGGLWATLGMGAAVILFFFVWHINQKSPVPEKNFAGLAFVTLLVTAILNLNSSQPDLSWEVWVRLVTIFLPLCLFFSPAIPPRADHPKFFAVLPVAIFIGGLALCLELYLNGPLLHRLRGPAAFLEAYNRGASYIMLMAFPVMAGLWFSKRRWIIVPFFLTLLMLTSLSDSRTAKLALMLAIPVMVLAQFVPVFMRRVLMLVPFSTIGWPFAAQWVFTAHYDFLARLPNSWHARIEIWDYMSYRIMERPFLGWGLGTSVTLPFAEPNGARYVYTTIPAGHPHNVMIQLWVELGLPGLALGIIFALLVLWKATRLDPRLVPFALGAWVASFCLCLLAYNFWTDSLFSAFALTSFAFMLLDRRLKSSHFSVDAPATH